MTLHEAVADAGIKKVCFDLMLARYDQDIADDAWQEVCVGVLKTKKPPTFETWEKARNYFAMSTLNRAGNIFHRQVLQIATEVDLDGADMPAARVVDPTPTVLEAWCEREQDMLAADAKQAITQGVQYTLWNLPPAARATMNVLLKTDKGGWIAAIQAEFGCTYKAAQKRLERANTYFKRFEPLRGLLRASEGYHQPSEKRTTSKYRTAV